MMVFALASLTMKDLAFVMLSSEDLPEGDSYGEKVPKFTKFKGSMLSLTYVQSPSLRSV